MGTDGHAAGREDGPLALSADCLGWARTAHYLASVADDGDVQLRSEAGAPTRYFVRRRGADRLELTEAVAADAEYPVLFVAEVDVLERYLVGLFADDIRDDLELPMLEFSWRREDLADGYQLGDMVRGYRTLRRTDGSPVAAAPDDTLSLVDLVPLSHFLRWSLEDVKRSFLNPEGKPLLRDGRYAPP